MAINATRVSAGGALEASSPAMVSFLQDGVSRYLNAELQRRAARTLGDELGDQIGGELGGLLGDLLGGAARGDAGGIAPPGGVAPVERADPPEASYAWTVPE